TTPTYDDRAATLAEVDANHDTVSAHPCTANAPSAGSSARHDCREAGEKPCHHDAAVAPQRDRHSSAAARNAVLVPARTDGPANVSCAATIDASSAAAYAARLASSCGRKVITAASSVRSRSSTIVTAWARSTP